ncbi:membrane protein [Streptomyces sp. AS58]|uniref:Sortase n=1 Tax=Streptomyces cadmiisoli TaxID=2184053 RepID=A0A2Z4J2U7_9ACTN|nr:MULTISPECIES: hypothetical protein [Streptomyces]AWW39399.1 hypothetical protein DN051_24350 [Streptomyces cadmiisoli]KOV51786.1 membrane protein [Streptomyces sp. AS58]
MGSLRRTLCTGVLAAFTAFAPTAAWPVGDGVTVTPSSPAPGGDLALRVTGCAGRTGTAASKAFVADAELTGTGGTLAGRARVRSMVGPGRYEVRVTCAGSPAGSLRTQVTVGAATAPPKTPATPVAPVSAGGGGSMRLSSADARATGPDTVHAVIGLLLASAAAVVVVVRGTRRGRRTG